MACENTAVHAEDWSDSGFAMPALFVGHGSPMNAIEDNEFSRAWNRIGRSLPKPRAILCVSAHWETAGTRVTAASKPETIHDFAGFPEPLFEVRYPAPGSPDLARLIEAIPDERISLDDRRGLDHGVWSVLCRMYPEAEIPVVQLSLDRTRVPERHYALGKALRALRNRGVLIVGSGNIVHNLSTIAWQDVAYEWALEFDNRVSGLIADGDHGSIVRFDRLGEPARLSVPTPEHFLPLLYILALQGPEEPITFFAEKVTLGSISMRSLLVGPLFGTEIARSG